MLARKNCQQKKTKALCLSEEREDDDEKRESIEAAVFNVDFIYRMESIHVHFAIVLTHTHVHL